MSDLELTIDDGELPTFEAPWQARAFGIAVAFCRAHGHDFAAFQDRLIAHLDGVDEAAMNAHVEEVYYEQWLESLEVFLVEEGVVDEAAIDDRQAEFADCERDASEFVVER